MIRYESFTYEGNAPFPPQPPTGKLPWQRRDDSQKAALQKTAALEEHHRQKMEDLSKKKGILGALDRGLAEVGYHVEKTANIAMQRTSGIVENGLDDLARHRYRDYFQSTAEEGEALLGDFSARVANALRSSIHGTPSFFQGWLQITTARLLFLVDTGLLPAGIAPRHAAPGGPPPSFGIPLNEIVCILPAVALKSTDGGIIVADSPDPSVIPQAIRVFTRDGRQHVFFHFTPPVNISTETSPIGADAYNVLSYAWRQRTQVPNPAIQYLPQGQPTRVLSIPPALPLSQTPPADIPYGDTIRETQTGTGVGLGGGTATTATTYTAPTDVQMGSAAPTDKENVPIHA